MNSKIIIPKNEQRILNGGILKNDIKYINIQDLTLDKSHVMVSVNIGSISNPFEYQGLAHFLEHMLFLGSKKYPKENQFEEFLNQHGGGSNAYTDTFQTVYYFSIFNEKLEEAIDMFSRFFIDPLFYEDSVNREINAIDSEHKKNIQQDNWRIYRFMGLISEENSMINKFGTGNLKSLQKPDIRKVMIDFYNKYYVSSNIKVVTVSSLDSSITSKYVTNSFSNIPKKIVPKIEIEKPFYNEKSESYFLKSISKEHTLLYIWEIEECVTNYLYSHSPYILSQIISSSNNNSIKNFLLKKGLIKSLSVEVYPEGIFILEVDLLDINNWQEVDSYIRFFMNDLKNNDWNKICKYVMEKDQLLFDYSSKSDANSFGLEIVNNLINYPVEKAYIGPSVIEKISVEEISKLLNEKLLFSRVKMVLSSDVDFNKESINNVTFLDKLNEEFYGLEYCRINLNLMSPKKFDYKIVTTNPFLDTKPYIIEKNDKISVPLYKRPGLWFGNVFNFRESRVYADLIFTNIEFVSTLETYLLTTILIRYINKSIKIHFNLASEIGFNTYFSLDDYNSILTISFSGHNYNFVKYVNSVFKYIETFKYNEYDEKLLISIIESIKDSYNNITKNNPWNYYYYIEDLNINKNSYKIDKVLKYLENLSLVTFINNIDIIKKRILYQSKFTSFFYGNIKYNKLFDSLINSNICINVKSIEKPKNNLKLLSNVDVIHPNSEETNNFVQLTFLIGKFTPELSLLLTILSFSVGNEFFSELRTKQQFGYLVSSRKEKIQKNYYFHQKIQSERSIKEIEAAIIKFNKNFMSTFTLEEFKKFKVTTKNFLEERQNNTYQLYSKYFNEIVENTFLFEREKLLLNKLDSITYEIFKKFYQEKILDSINTNSFTKIYIRKQ